MYQMDTEKIEPEATDRESPYVKEAIPVEKLSHDRQVEDKTNPAQPSTEEQRVQLLSKLLKYGVLLASFVVLVGGILYLIRHGGEPANYGFFQGEPSEFRSPSGVVTAVLSGSRRGIIQLGLLILIATPIARVAISFLTFLRQRDFTYVIITLFVLSGLLYSLIGAYF